MTDDRDTTELRLAKAYRAEAESIKKAAEQDLEAARYERGQIEHAKRVIEQTEKSIAEREQRLAQLNEADLIAREKAVADKLAEVQGLLAQYSSDRHGAARALVEINEREKRKAAA